MAKRFIDTGLFKDSWYSSLKKDAKLAWIWLLMSCDHAGIIDLNIKLMRFETEINSLETVIKELGNRLIYLRDNYHFIPKFITYQYKTLNPVVKAHKSVIDRLNSFNLLNDNLTVKQQLGNSLVTVQDKDKDKDKVKDSNVGENLFLTPKDLGLYVDKNLDIKYVKLTKGQLEDLEDKLTKREVQQKILDLNLYIGSKGKKYKDHYLTILSWFRKDMKK